MKLLNFRESKHLVERTGIGAQLDQILLYSGKSLDSAISQLFSVDISSEFSAPILLKPNILRRIRKSNNRKLLSKTLRAQSSLLTNWGMQNLLKSDNPLHERMVWFWHNHFTSSWRKGGVYPMLKHDLSIREFALGSFSDLLEIMTLDPAMLIYLDGRSNVKGRPNENFSRELLELFTLGEGNYTEHDVKEAARAFTGWGVNSSKNKAVFRNEKHDNGIKSFMGKKDNLTSDDILTILLSHPRTAEHICEKLWYEFISTESPEPGTIKSWADVFRSSGYDISSLLKTIFGSVNFWDHKHRGALVKSPIDLIIGSLRSLNLRDSDLPLTLLRNTFKRMGQELYAPPNVKGWKGGVAWIDDVRLPIRQQFLQRLTHDKRESGNKTIKTKKGMTNMMIEKKQREIPAPVPPDLPIHQWIEWLLPISPVTIIHTKQPQALLKAILLDPVYQLK